MSDKPLPTDLELTALDLIFREHPHDRLDRLRTEDPLAGVRSRANLRSASWSAVGGYPVSVTTEPIEET